MKIEGKLLLKGISKYPLVSKEIEIDKKKYEEAEDKYSFLQLSFLHAIADELEVTCEVVE